MEEVGKMKNDVALENKDIRLKYTNFLHQKEP